MNTYDRYYEIACQTAEKLPSKLCDFFNSISKDKKLSVELDKDISVWLEKAKEGSDYPGELGYNLVSLVMHLLSTSGKDTGLKEDRLQYRDTLRFRRRYLKQAIQREYKNIKDGKDSSSGGTLRSAWKDYSVFMQSPVFGVAKKYGSEMEFYEDKVSEVVSWADNPKSMLIEYPFFGYCTPKKRYQDFISDLSFNVFDVLSESYGDELSSVNHGSNSVVKTPDFISGRGVFGATSSVEDLEAEVEISEARSYNQHTVSMDDGEIVIKTVIDRIPGDFSDISSEEEKSAVISSLVETGQMKLRNNMLDSTDMELFTHIFSSFSVEDVNRGRKEFSLKELMRTLYTEAKEDRKFKVLEHLDRLANYLVEYTVRSNTTDKIVDAGNITFFNVSYHISQGDEAKGDLVIDASLKQIDGSQSSFLNEIKKYKSDDITVEVFPSFKFREAIITSMNTEIFAESYKRIPSSKSKNMLMFLQSKRSAIYPETTLDLSVAFLAQYFRLDKQKRSRQVKYLEEMMEPLKAAGVLVKDYSVDKLAFHIDFLPYTETELSAYHIGDKEARERAGI